ncbi:hypothetical protein HX871_18805 [Pseudomonas reactans]|uniref:Uncharacterized protein n=1 Tax=Pseudomonas reactans TaxID=117680 RepID=A0ABX2QYC6_9PSED|nr:hypothetical protein [Pseudomonas reactans]NWA41099.1 hypothetical protein [Pseudomonas reactans]NWD96478.1 hypothetical protein [Pseudomonas reactans]
MSGKQTALSDGTRYEPALPIDAIEPLDAFNKDEFADYIYSEFTASEKIYEPLKDLLAAYRIEPGQILGTEYPENENTAELFQFEQAKLLVLARMMSVQNNKWRSIISRSKPTMSAVLGSSAPSSLAQKEKIELSRYYISLLKGGIPEAQLDSAQPLLESVKGEAFEGGHFEMLGSTMSTYTANFITARQREIVVTSNKQHHRMDPVKGYKHWPSDVSPAFGAAEAVHRARDGFVSMLELQAPDADKDMARVRLLKDFFLDAESSYWEETHQLNMAIQGDLPPELGRLNLLMTRDQVSERVAQAFDVDPDDLSADLLAEAECLIWLYGLKHCPFTVERIDASRNEYFEGNRVPHYVAIAAVILNHLRLTHKNIKINVPGETYGKVPVYKAFREALRDAGVDVSLGVEANKAQLAHVFRDMDTKAMTYMTSLFSIATNADDGQAKFLRMDYVPAQAEVRAWRTELLAELPQMLKAYSCRTAYMLICTFACVMRDCTRNPLG